MRLKLRSTETLLFTSTYLCAQGPLTQNPPLCPQNTSYKLGLAAAVSGLDVQPEDGGCSDTVTAADPLGCPQQRCRRGFSRLCFANLCRKLMREGAWAAAPRGIPACLGKHSCQDPAVRLPGHICTHSQADLSLSRSCCCWGRTWEGDKGADFGYPPPLTLWGCV